MVRSSESYQYQYIEIACKVYGTFGCVCIYGSATISITSIPSNKLIKVDGGAFTPSM